MWRLHKDGRRGIQLDSINKTQLRKRRSKYIWIQLNSSKSKVNFEIPNNSWRK